MSEKLPEGIGIPNNYNMCYINSVIQALLECKGFCNDIIYMYLYYNIDQDPLNIDLLYDTIIKDCITEKGLSNIKYAIDIDNPDVLSDVKATNKSDLELCQLFVKIFYCLINYRYNYIKNRAIKVKSTEQKDDTYMEKYSIIISLLQLILRLDIKIIIANNIEYMYRVICHKLKKSKYADLVNFLEYNTKFIFLMLEPELKYLIETKYADIVKHYHPSKNREEQLYGPTKLLLMAYFKYLIDIKSNIVKDLTFFSYMDKLLVYKNKENKIIFLANKLINYTSSENVKIEFVINNFSILREYLTAHNNYRIRLSKEFGQTPVERIEEILNAGPIKLCNNEHVIPFPIKSYIKGYSLLEIDEHITPEEKNMLLIENFNIVNYGDFSISRKPSVNLTNITEEKRYYCDYDTIVLREIDNQFISFYCAYMLDSVVVGSGTHFICNAKGYYIDDDRIGFGSIPYTIERMFYSYYTEVKKTDNFNTYCDKLFTYYLKIILDYKNNETKYNKDHAVIMINNLIVKYIDNIHTVEVPDFMCPIYITLYRLLQHRDEIVIIEGLGGMQLSMDDRKIIDCIVQRSPLLMLS